MIRLSLRDLLQLVPTEWTEKPGYAGVLFSGYRCLSPGTPLLKQGTNVTLPDAIVQLLWGEVEYFGGTNDLTIEIDAEGRMVLHAPEMGSLLATSMNAVVLIIQPFERPNPDEVGNINQIRERRQAICALLSVAIGPTLTYKFLFENQVSVVPGRVTRTYSGIEIRRDLFLSPLCSAERLDHVSALDKSISLLDPKRHRRFQQALHWYDIGIRASGIDCFVNLWIALEALVLRTGTNIGPLKESVARAYGMKRDVASQHFGIGRIYGIRGSIFHGQERLQVKIELLSYLCALFVDVLQQELGLPCEGRAREALDGRDFDQSGFI